MKYLALVGVYEQLEGTSKRLEKTFYLSEFLKTVPLEEMGTVMLLVQGKVFPAWDERKIGMAARLLLKSINIASGIDTAEIEKEWKKTGDLGKTAENIIGKKKQATLFVAELTIEKVFANLQKQATIEGAGTVDKKVKLIAELLTSAKPKEAKYIIRTVLEDLRVGLGAGTVRDAITWAFFGKEIGFQYDKKENKLEVPDREKYNSYVEAVQEAIDVANDFAMVAKKARKGLEGLKEISLEPGKPVKVMLYQKVKTMQDAFEKVGKPAAFEYKYDGFRLQIHKHNGKISLFTRRLDEVTKQFPDVVKFVEENVSGDSFIIDSEAVGYDANTKKYTAFQNISQRIRRKYDIASMAEKFPVELDVFDVIYFNGENLIKQPFSERRKIVEQIVQSIELCIKPAVQLITDDETTAEAFYQKSLEAGNEGVMIKNLEGVYKPGSRVGYGVKLKPTMDTLEVVIVGAEYGEGKRSAWLASFIIAIRDPDTDEVLEIGRVGTGIKEKDEEGLSFGQLTEMLKPLIIKEEGKIVYVKPEIVIEVDYEEIQASPTYKSGFALRFPRFVKLREDRGVGDINTLEEVEMLYEAQRGRG
ncbi:ATP-dependent DNA ligase [Candidatus Woesearchaeota archaeon]|nr:ATP-dependent DNA ligase [Candidatus Woesearchaeota archaeon]MBW3005211.1 ATP-dependent DNA ligase [Candidatus Woesearchaeota archaeon]